ncbi:hypothetical protein, conserved [Eimeria praecox]|uniref:Ubiquitin-like protease family profile domain-containing protein n=1 Tax=Eimeria praecox TaxID=51316 RepID=U6H6M7_9EIME|nr:hypothetical protein, conserved [Eimeria praecox]
MKGRDGIPAVLGHPGVTGCRFPSPRYQRPLSMSEFPMPCVFTKAQEEEGPRTFWWVRYEEAQARETSLRTSTHGEQLTRKTPSRRAADYKERGPRELPQDEQQQLQYGSSLKMQLQRGRDTGEEGSSTEESDDETIERQQQQQLQQRQHRRHHRTSLDLQLHRKPAASNESSGSDSSDEEDQGQQQAQQERQRRHRHRNSAHLQLQRNSWKPGPQAIPEDSDEELQKEQPLPPEALASGKRQLRETVGVHPGDLHEDGELSESDWSDGDRSEDEGQADAAAKATTHFKGQILPQNLEGSSLPASVVNRAIAKINKRYEQCGDTAREMTSAEEELIDSVIQRWEGSGFQPFEIEGMTVDSAEQSIILHNEALTPNLINIYLRALEVNKIPLTTRKRRRPKQTSLPVEVASKLLSPSLSAEDSEQLLAAMEAQRVLEVHITVLPVMKSPMHYSALVLDTIKGPSAVLFLLRWFDPFGESGMIPMQNILTLLKRLAAMHVMKNPMHYSALVLDTIDPALVKDQDVLSLRPTITKNNDGRDSGVLCCMVATQLAEGCSPSASEGDALYFRKQMPTITKNNDGRDSGVLCCMVATQLAEGCSPSASEGDALYFRKQMLLRLDFAGRWNRSTPEGE